MQIKYVVPTFFPDTILVIRLVTMLLQIHRVVAKNTKKQPRVTRVTN